MKSVGNKPVRINNFTSCAWRHEARTQKTQVKDHHHPLSVSNQFKKQPVSEETWLKMKKEENKNVEGKNGFTLG